MKRKWSEVLLIGFMLLALHMCLGCASTGTEFDDAGGVVEGTAVPSPYGAVDFCLRNPDDVRCKND